MAAGQMLRQGEQDLQMKCRRISADWINMRCTFELSVLKLGFLLPR